MVHSVPRAYARGYILSRLQHWSEVATARPLCRGILAATNQERAHGINDMPWLPLLPLRGFPNRNGRGLSDGKCNPIHASRYQGCSSIFPAPGGAIET